MLRNRLTAELHIGMREGDRPFLCLVFWDTALVFRVSDAVLLRGLSLHINSMSATVYGSISQPVRHGFRDTRG